MLQVFAREDATKVPHKGKSVRFLVKPGTGTDIRRLETRSRTAWRLPTWRNQNLLIIMMMIMIVMIIMMIMMTVTIKSLPTLRNQGLMIDRIYCILVWMNTQWDKYLMMVLLSYIALHW